MTRQALKTRVRAVWEVVADILWRGFGALLFVLGASAGVGSVVTGSWINGVIIAWGTLMLGVIGAVGYAIMITGRADREVVAKAYRDAAEKATDKSAK